MSAEFADIFLFMKSKGINYIWSALSSVAASAASFTASA